MVKIVFLGSCKYEPYKILAKPQKQGQLWNTETGYNKAIKQIYPAITEADIIIVYAPDGIGEHTKRDLVYAESLNKKIVIIK